MLLMRSSDHDWAAHAPRAADPDVEHGARRGERQGQLLFHQRGAGQRPCRRSKRRNGFGRLPQRLQPGPDGRMAAARQTPDWPQLRIIRIGRQCALHQLQHGHTVDQRVVELAVEGEPTVVQPLDEVCLPQRAVPVEQAAVQQRGQLEQIADPPRRRQRRAPHVVVDVDVIRVVVGPSNVGESADNPGRSLAEGGLEIAVGDQSVVGLPGELRSGALRRLEQLQAADVHGVLARFGQQENRVGRRHQLHRPIKALA